VSRAELCRYAAQIGGPLLICPERARGADACGELKLRRGQ
jgi:hypothetical protein